jgi:hypothetical protein
LENSKNEVMDLEKYKNDGWGLSKKEFEDILEIISNHDKEELRVVEFGSGISTQFLIDINREGVKKITIDSFDDDPTYAYKGKDNCLNLMIRPLMECSDGSYNQMFDKKDFISELTHQKKTPLHSRQKNNFYTINEGDLTGIYDLMILDGPNGNGRNISYLHMHKHLDVGSIVLIDDYTHYDFVDKFKIFFETERLYENTTGMKNQWENGGDYEIYKITAKK